MCEEKNGAISFWKQERRGILGNVTYFVMYLDLVFHLERSLSLSLSLSLSQEWEAWRINHFYPEFSCCTTQRHTAFSNYPIACFFSGVLTLKNTLSTEADVIF